ncbi:hypothetical protein, partial [Escherichia coli]|uniref:hypothetical protein n=1 Tax=Escherichia coli TaxID=562 RepID=UPI001A7E18E8
MSLNKPHVGKHKHTEYEARCQKNAFSGCHTWSLSSASAFATIILKWFTEFGHLNRGDMLTSEQHRCHNE